MINIEKLPTKSIKIETVCKTTCESCGAELSYVYDEDCFMVHGNYGFICPCCGEFIIVNANEDEDDKPIFPKNFFHFSQSDSAVHIENNQIQKWIDEIREKLSAPFADDYYYAGSGDTMVFGFRTVEGIDIMVCQDYYEWSEY